MPLKLITNLFTPKHIQKLQNFLLKNPNPKIVIFTGAEILEDSGLSPLNHDYCLQNQSFNQNPKNIIDFYNQKRLTVLNDVVQPNIAHKKISELVSLFEETVVITQNIDELHEKSDTTNLYKLNGSLFHNKCNVCNHKEFNKDPIDFPNFCINCYEKNQIRPDVVFQNEKPHFINEFIHLIHSCDLFISIGADQSIIQKYIGDKKINALSLSISSIKKNKNSIFDIHVNEKVSKGVTSIVDLLLSHSQKI